MNLSQVCVIVIVGMTFVIATGGIDLSVGSIMAIAGAFLPQSVLRGALLFVVVLLQSRLTRTAIAD